VHDVDSDEYTIGEGIDVEPAGTGQGKFVIDTHRGPRPGFALITAQAGIQICTSDQDVGKTVLMNALDSGSSPE